MAVHKKLDYECRSCGYILDDVELENNGELCNECLLNVDYSVLSDEEDEYWEEYK